MTASKSTWEQYRMPALLDVADFLWVNPPFANMTGHVWPAAANSTGIPGLRGGWQADVTQAIADSSELFRAGAFVGVFLGDEPCCSGVSAEALALAAAFVKALIAPLGGWTYVNECDHTFWTIGNTTYPGQMTGLVPAGIDVISIDRYMPANGTGQLTLPSVGCNYDGYYGPAQEAACNRAFYERHIFPKLRPGQRVAVAPGLFANGSSAANATAEEDQLIAKLDAYWVWMQEEKRLVGMTPWHWIDQLDGKFAKTPNYVNTWGRGVVSFPRLVDRLRQIGKEIGRGNLLRAGTPVN
jgi:hypothetical protein